MSSDVCDCVDGSDGSNGFDGGFDGGSDDSDGFFDGVDGSSSDGSDGFGGLGGFDELKSERERKCSGLARIPLSVSSPLFCFCSDALLVQCY